MSPISAATGNARGNGGDLLPRNLLDSSSGPEGMSQPGIGRAPGTGLLVVPVAGRSCPLFRCAGCGEWIRDARSAGVVWSPEDWTQRPARPVVLCKTNRCLADPRWDGWPSEALDVFLVNLIANTGLSSGPRWAAARHRARQARRLG
jgi:hypothetical protein